MGVFVTGQLLIGSILHNLAVVDDEDLFAVANRAQSVSNDDRSSALHRSVQRLLHDFLALLVQSRSRFIENQDLWVFDKCTSNGDPLLLAAREFGTLETTVLFESLAQLDLALAVPHLIDGVCMQSFDPPHVLLHKLGMILADQLNKCSITALTHPLCNKFFIKRELV